MRYELRVTQKAPDVHVTYVKIIVNSDTCSEHHVHKSIILSLLSTVWEQSRYTRQKKRGTQVNSLKFSWKLRI